ncbi:metal ABC transporter solute-binding protein, Zn/Mn family [Youngiibacter fragilis]|uniref:ABC transporter substrate-binding protein n=1 Tax=Youngiibacter fragilis 232.1 TaxID=994573 RepID=V7I1Q2_9CLOT|nr:zinc ABC transporter substrate-binding protein [Youngiibacter fragilis]ETA79803.1 ABC transporter substrate-binding protein [Youngiibacter fragilis 232.1]
MKRKFKIAAAVLAAMVVFTACSGEKGDAVGKISVSTTINPVHQIVTIIGGDKVEASRMVPAGSEAHDFEPTIRDMETLSKSSILFISGLGMEPWADKAKETTGSKGLVTAELSSGIGLIGLEENGHEGEEEEHGDFDPHVWLSLDGMVTMAENAEKALSAASPENAEYFRKNLEAFRKDALALKEEYLPKFAPYQGKAFVTGHAAFGYMCRELGLVQMSVEGPFQEGEPTPKKLEELINFAKENGIKTIFLEEQASPKVSETLAREVGASTETLNPLESEGDLLQTIKENYDKILKSME